MFAQQIAEQLAVAAGGREGAAVGGAEEGAESRATKYAMEARLEKRQATVVTEHADNVEVAVRGLTESSLEHSITSSGASTHVRTYRITTAPSAEAGEPTGWLEWASSILGP